MCFIQEYLGITGDAEFCDLAQKLCFGEDSEAVKSGRICSVQTLSGTGSLRVGLEFLAKFFPKATVYMSNPTWGNHKTIIGRVGLKMKYFSYWDAQKRCLDEPGMMRDLSGAQPGDIVLLHACAHNPTGVDPTQEQWHKIADIIKRKQLLTFFDTAYQGFASGNPDRDAYSIRYWTKMGMELVVSQSFAKNFGLYNERIGGFHVVTGSAHQAKAAKSQISLIIRPMYSNPPVHGARIVKAILGDKKLRAQWMSEMQEMSQRIDVCRKLLYKELTQLKTPGTWEHITSQIGMFSFTGLTKAQVAVMTKKHHVYMLSNGRISMAGVNKKNAAYLARAIDDVVRNVHQ